MRWLSKTSPAQEEGTEALIAGIHSTVLRPGYTLQQPIQRTGSPAYRTGDSSPEESCQTLWELLLSRGGDDADNSVRPRSTGEGIT